MPPRDWDATSYERLSAPMTAMGADVLDRLVLRGDETVLDAGCGTGNVTRVLRERLPHGRVIAVDAAPSMVAQARALLPADVDVRQADLLELELEEPLDAVFSTATFHWIGDHERLFVRLHGALRPGGRLVAQWGGQGNVADVTDAGFGAAAEPRFASYFDGWTGDWTFATPEATERRLRGAGFSDVWCWPTRVDVAPRRSGRLPQHDLPRVVPRAAARRAARPVHRRCPRAAARPARDPLRAAEHPGSASELRVKSGVSPDCRRPRGAGP